MDFIKKAVSYRKIFLKSAFEEEFVNYQPLRISQGGEQFRL